MQKITLYISDEEVYDALLRLVGKMQEKLRRRYSISRVVNLILGYVLGYYTKGEELEKLKQAIEEIKKRESKS